ncbi:hypothetical protein [Evansella clarkii]|uniref:hypothetical protein n=1 Tax=Evansella clarkii TaxID=79879 RepID=UPI0011163D3F|nr:hypothetical protein [Evansella clarkii]
MKQPGRRVSRLFFWGYEGLACPNSGMNHEKGNTGASIVPELRGNSRERQHWSIHRARTQEKAKRRVITRIVPWMPLTIPNVDLHKKPLFIIENPLYRDHYPKITTLPE